MRNGGTSTTYGTMYYRCKHIVEFNLDVFWTFLEFSVVYGLSMSLSEPSFNQYSLFTKCNGHKKSSNLNLPARVLRCKVYS